MRTLRLFGTFYRNFVFSSFIITACCASVYGRFGIETFFPLFIFKLLTLGISVAFINSYKKKEWYYYRHLGLSQQKLWTCLLSFDLACFLLLILLIHQLV